MIKAQDLRIGNFVEMPHGIAEIEYFIEGGIHTVDGHGSNFEACQPIPLTQDWLVRFGFLYVDQFMGMPAYDMPHEGRFGYIFRIKKGLYGNGWIKAPTELQYVHQLQNLFFAKTGVELQLLPKAVGHQSRK